MSEAEPDGVAAGRDAPPAESLEEILEEFGLPEKQVAILEAVLDCGTARIATVAEEAGVSRRYVYDAASELARRGLIEARTRESPARLSAVGADEVVRRLRDELTSVRQGIEAVYRNGTVSGSSETGLDALESNFGLSETGRAVYEAILAAGSAGVCDLSDRTGVSRPTAYRKVEELADRGLVNVAEQGVRTARAVPPAEAVAALEARARALGDAFDDRFGTTDAPDAIEVIESRRSLLCRVRDLLADADRQVTISVPADVLDSIRPDLLAAVDRETMVLLLLSQTDPAAVETDRVRDACTAARALDYRVPFQVTVDDEMVLVPPEMMHHQLPGEHSAIVHQQTQLNSIVRGAFVCKDWPRAEEVYVADPVDLPTTFGHFHRAVFHATLHHRAGRNVLVEAAGQPTHTGEGATTVRGPLVEVRQHLLEPTTSRFPMENSLIVDSDSGRVTVGSPAADDEDVAAHRLRLETE